MIYFYLTSLANEWIVISRKTEYLRSSYGKATILVNTCVRFPFPKFFVDLGITVVPVFQNTRGSTGEGEGDIWVRTRVWRVNVRHLKNIQDRGVKRNGFPDQYCSYVWITYQRLHNDAIAVQNTVLTTKQGSLNTLGKTYCCRRKNDWQISRHSRKANNFARLRTEEINTASDVTRAYGSYQKKPWSQIIRINVKNCLKKI